MPTRYLRYFSKTSSALVDYGAYISIFCNFLILFLVLAEIALRSLFRTSFLFTYEVTAWLLTALTLMGGAWTLRNGGHVKINIINNLLSTREQRILEVFLASIGAVACGMFSWYAWLGLVDKYACHIVGNTIYRTPIWFAWIPLVLGAILIALQFLVMAVENISALKEDPIEDEGQGHRFARWVICGIGAFLILLVFGLVFFLDGNEVGVGWTLAIILVILFSLVGSSLWIFVSLGVTGVVGLLLFTGYPAGAIASECAFYASSNFVLVCLPLFIFMGELMFSSGMSKDLYSGIAPLVERLPGGLIHSNIVSCTIFAAISGSSSVTTAFVGSVAIPELKRLGYDEGITLGSLAGAGTLGLLIPPSIILILYGAITSESIGQLFLAGIIPGLMISVLFMLYIGLRAIQNPSIVPTSHISTWKERFSGAKKILPMLTVIGLVLGLIYSGVTTPTEAGAIGALAAIIVALIYGSLTWENVSKASYATLRTTCMIMFIVITATVVSSCLAYLRIPQQLAATLVAAQLSKYSVLAVLCLIYLALGCLFDGASILLLTLPIVYPLMKGLGFDGVWVGILVTILIEAAQITPPVGFNLYVLQNISGRDISLIVRNTIPFFLLMMLAIIILIFFPEIALFLPKMMIGR